MPTSPDWPRTLAALATAGPFDALAILEIDAETCRVVHASSGHAAVVGATLPAADTPWGALEAGKPTLCRSPGARAPRDHVLERLGAKSAAVVPLDREGAGCTALLATSKARWRKPSPRLARLAEVAPVVSAVLRAEEGDALDALLRALGGGGPVRIDDGLRRLATVVGARFALLAEPNPDDPGMGQPLVVVDLGDTPTAAPLPSLPLAALRGRWNGQPPASAAWLPGGGARSACGRELRDGDGQVVGAFVVYHDAPLVWTGPRERAVSVFAAVAGAALAERRGRERTVNLARVGGGLPLERAGILAGDLGPRVFDAASAASSIGELLRPGVPEDVELLVDVEPAALQVKVDPVRFQRCVRDLLRAAVELPGVRRVRLAARPRRLGSADHVDALARPKGGAAEPSGWVSLLVAAEGAGLDEATELAMLAENAAALFAHEERGYLLGRRENGSSRTLELLLPAARAAGVFPAVARDKRAPAHSVAHRRPLVLVVDDEEGVRRTLTRLLGAAGARVLVAADGLEALDTVRKHGDEIDLVFVDVRMPNMGGLATLKAVRATAPDLPVVLMSGYAPTDEERRDLDAMAHGFLSKPFRLDEVRRIVAELAGRRDGASAPSAARPS